MRTTPEKTTGMVQDGSGFHNGFSCRFRAARGSITRSRDNRSFFLVPGKFEISVMPCAAASFGKRQSGADFGKTAELADGRLLVLALVNQKITARGNYPRESASLGLGIRRAEAKITLANLPFKMLRFVFHETRAPTG